MATRVIGLAELRARFARIPVKVRVAAKVAIDHGADELIAFQRRLVSVDEGILIASIRKEPGRHELSVFIRAGGPTTTKAVRAGVDASYDYAMAIEFGTRKMHARPFFYPAYRASRKRIRGRITRAMKKAILS